MTGIVRTSTTLAVAVLLLASAADAALTTSACLVSKRKAWGNFRKCQVTEQVKLLKGKPTDLAACDTALQTALTKITAKATKVAIACRYRDNGDGTVTDYDTGLMWEQKTLGFGGICFFAPLGEISHCVNDTFSWANAQGFVSGASTDGTTVPSFLAGDADWRLPTIAELRTIVDATAPGCSSPMSPCIDPIFGPTANNYWSATTYATNPTEAWVVFFHGGGVTNGLKSNDAYVRAVRTGL